MCSNVLFRLFTRWFTEYNTQSPGKIGDKRRAAKSHLNNYKYEYSLIRMVYTIEIILVVREIQISCKSSLK